MHKQTTNMKEQRPLPKIQDLHNDLQEAFKTDQLNLLLNQPVPLKWIKNHPTASTKDDNGNKIPVKYIPIDKVEFMLTKIFGEWRVEILSEGQMFNSVYVKVRLHFKRPTDGEWGFHDGIGAVGVQTDKGASASDLSAIKQDAIMKALPAAESYAIKDAAEKLGVLFGKDLNRKETLGYEVTYQTIPVDEKHEQFFLLRDRILKCISTIESLEHPFVLTDTAKQILEKDQVTAIKLLCDEAKITDDEKDAHVLSYLNEEASAEAIVNGLKERYGIKFINQL